MSVVLITDALKTAGALVPLNSGEITSPVPHVDLTLPSEFDQCLLLLRDFVTSTNDNVGGVFGSGGAWWNDASNFDTYSSISVAASGPVFTLISAGSAVAASRSDIWLCPGSADITPSARIVSVFLPNLPGAGSLTSDYFGLNSTATVPPVLARADNFRMVPEFDGSATQTSSTFTAGTYHLFGVPAP